MIFAAALTALLDTDDWDEGFIRPTISAIARAAELVPPALDVTLSCIGTGDLRVHVKTPAYRRLTLVVPADPDDPMRIYWRRRSDDQSAVETATRERWQVLLAQEAEQ